MIRWLVRNRFGLGLMALLIAGAIVSESIAERSTNGPALSSHDSTDSGALAVFLWLERLGYQVGRLEPGGADLAPTQMLFLLDPIRGYTSDESHALLDWVRRGGILVYAPPASPFSFADTVPSKDPLETDLGFTNSFTASTTEASPSLPYFTAPPAQRFVLDSDFAFNLTDPGWVPLVESNGHAFVAVRSIGDGQAYLVSGDSLFSNHGLGQMDNAAFILNILTHHPNAHTVAFEEEHHTLLEEPDLTSAARDSPWGWAVAYLAVICFVFLLWGGRRFGPALVPVHGLRRSGGEYVESFAGLLQRAQGGPWVQAQYARLVRRRVARLLGVRSDLPAAELARLVAERQPIDEAELAAQLLALDGGPIGDRRLLDEVRSIESTLAAIRGWRL